MGAFRRAVDGLVQSFEDGREGISDKTLGGGEAAVEKHFLEIYEREAARIRDTVREQEPHLSQEALEALTGEIDGHLRKVLIPAYARLALKYTPKERNDFYHLKESLHGLERVTWGFLGIIVGLFVIWAPFIPIWSKEWVLPFMILGLIYPNLRRYLATNRYEKQINQLVDQTDRAFERMDKVYLTQGAEIPELQALKKTTEEEELRRKRIMASEREKER